MLVSRVGKVQDIKITLDKDRDLSREVADNTSMALDKYKSRNSSRQSTISCSENKWEVYTETLLEKGAVSGFGVYSNTTYHKWTSTPNFAVRPDALRVIVSGFEDELPLRINGISINSMTFTFTRMGLNRRVMVGRNTASGAGCVLYLCRTCLLVATCEAQQSSLCFTTIERFGDILTVQNF